MSDPKNDKLDLDDLGGGSDEIELTVGDDDGEAPAEMPVDQPAEPIPGDLGAIHDIPVQLSAVLGKATMPVNQLLRLGRGAVLELDRKVGEPVDILVNNRLVARGEVVVIDERIGVTMTEINKSET